MKIPKQAIERLVYSSESRSMFNAIYVSPAQALRNAANEIEQRENDLAEIRRWLQSLD